MASVSGLGQTKDGKRERIKTDHKKNIIKWPDRKQARITR